MRTKYKLDEPIFGGWGLGLVGEAYVQPELYLGLIHSSLQSVKVTFLSFFTSRARILAFFTLCKMWNMFKVNIKDTIIRKVSDKVKYKDTIDVVLASLLLTLNKCHFLLKCVYCCLWSVNWRLELLFVVLTLRACWNQFRQSFHLWGNR